jgi:Tfp pilus assembly PilM family ATPase
MPADARGAIVAHADAVLRELRVSFSYAAHQYANTAVSRCLLVGGGAGIPGLAAYAAEVLGIEVRASSPADLIEYPPSLAAACRAPGLTAAAGLAQFAEL